MDYAIDCVTPQLYSEISLELGNLIEDHARIQLQVYRGRYIISHYSCPRSSIVIYQILSSSNIIEPYRPLYRRTALSSRESANSNHSVHRISASQPRGPNLKETQVANSLTTGGCTRSARQDGQSVTTTGRNSPQYPLLCRPG
jgi:hypothetical protein